MKNSTRITLIALTLAGVIASLLFSLRHDRELDEWIRSEDSKASWAAAQKMNRERFDNRLQVVPTFGDSMQPALGRGEWVVVDYDYPFDDLKIGDVVIVEPKLSGIFIHRIVSRSPNLLVTKGDNNDKPDEHRATRNTYQGRAYLVDR